MRNEQSENATKILNDVKEWNVSALLTELTNLKTTISKFTTLVDKVMFHVEQEYTKCGYCGEHTGQPKTHICDLTKSIAVCSHLKPVKFPCYECEEAKMVS